MIRGFGYFLLMQEPGWWSNKASSIRAMCSPQSRFEANRVMAREHLPVQLACRVLHVAESGYCAWRDRPPSNRLVEHTWLTEAIVGDSGPVFRGNESR